MGTWTLRVRAEKDPPEVPSGQDLLLEDPQGAMSNIENSTAGPYPGWTQGATFRDGIVVRVFGYTKNLTLAHINRKWDEGVHAAYASRDQGRVLAYSHPRP